MAIGDGWTSRLLGGLAELLDAAGVGVWHPDGAAYAVGDTAIVIRVIPQAPDRIVSLAAYPQGTASQGMADHDAAVQIRLRAGVDPRDCDDLADVVFDRLDSLAGVTLGGVPLVQMWRQSYTSLGKDANGRWERSENYYLQAMRPTTHRTD
jgi:Bacteriophage minor capsid protein